MSKKSDESPLPLPNVQYSIDLDKIDEAFTMGMMSNPIYVGVPPYPRIVSDEIWVKAVVEMIEEQGAEQFLVNMLYMLRTSMTAVIPDEAIPEDYDGPWPDDDDDDDYEDDEEMLFEDVDLEDELSPWHHPLEGHIYCSHDALPMIFLDEEFTCVAEFLNAHINESPITDLITEPVLALVFQNGHTLPLLCPDCGGSSHIDDHNELLEEVNGLTIIDVDWDDDIEELILEFGQSGSDENDDEDAPYLEVHLDSVRGLTCPHRILWDGEDEDDLDF